MKNCIKCGELKEISDFHINKKMKDGHLNKCKICATEHQKSYYKEKILDKDFREAEKKRNSEKYRRLKYRERYSGKYNPNYYKIKKTINRIKFFNKFPEKKKCYSLSSDLPRESGHNNHHWSYNIEHAKDIIKIPKPHHHLLHRHMIYDQSFMMYRDSSGNLLDTKQSHIDLLHKILDEDSR